MSLAGLIQTIQNRFFRPKGVLYGPGVVLYPTARIYNYCGVRNAIRIGACSHIKGELLTFGHGGSITLGQYCFLGEGARIWSAERIHIGDRVLISHNVNIFDNDTHPLDPRQRQAQFKAIITAGHPRHLDLREKPVRIEDDALIGCLAIILSGVTIGAGAIVGAGSVVTKDVPPLTVVAGNPARIIRRLGAADLREE